MTSVGNALPRRDAIYLGGTIRSNIHAAFVLHLTAERAPTLGRALLD